MDSAPSSDRPDTQRQSSIEALVPYPGALAMVAVSTVIGLWIAPRWGTASVDMIYLPAVLVAGALWGLGPALVAGAAAALAYNFFFTVPIHTFRMDRVTDIVTVIVLVLVALVTSQLAARMRSQARLAEAHAARNATIAGFARKLLGTRTDEQIAQAACDELHKIFDCNIVLVSGMPAPSVIKEVPEGNTLTPSDIAAAALTIETGEPAGHGTSRLQPLEWLFYPVHSGGAAVAAVGLARDDGTSPVDADRIPLLTNLLDQVALALERTEPLQRGLFTNLLNRPRKRWKSAKLDGERG
jgi:two-component system sensor histidine kinase KdpD